MKNFLESRIASGSEAITLRLNNHSFVLRARSYRLIATGLPESFTPDEAAIFSRYQGTVALIPS
jgi:hypothetical protein